MNYFPHTTPLRPVRPNSKSQASALDRDVLWNRPLFRAPALLIPQISLDDLPFTATRPVRVPVRRD
jgi:hypothetical protein